MKKIAVSILALTLISTAAIAADAKAGQAAYDKSCKGCHGAAGSPNPAVAKMLSANIPELGSAPVQSQTDADLAKVIAEGKGKMKPIKTLIGPPEDVVAFLRTLKK